MRHHGAMSEQRDVKTATVYDRIPNWAIVGVFVLAAGLGLLAYLLRDTSPEAGSERDAKASCQTFVDRRLKAPSTAEYSGESASLGAETRVWTVVGSVDSGNSFGGTVRNRFTCATKIADAGSWELVDLQVTNN